jgi:hypothetical protein
MSLTSYRAAPPRANICGMPQKTKPPRGIPGSGSETCEWVFLITRRLQSLATTYSSIA